MPEANGLIVEPLDDRPVPRRRRRYRAVPGAKPDALPEDWRRLLAHWLARGGRSRWETLARDAGPAGLAVSQALLDWLLRHGWATVDEERRHGDWWPLRVELREIATLRTALGLPDHAALAQDWENLRAALLASDDPSLHPALASLDGLPAARAIARGELLDALQRWRAEQRGGTRRDFALFARGATKAVSDAEWRWLDDTLDLADFRIERHTPTLLLAASLALQFDAGAWPLDAAPDFAALTPDTLARVRAIAHPPSAWLLVENRTSFEREARTRPADTAVVWLPGYPPTWWRQAMRDLLHLAPAPARIACDPDPAGIEIALHTGQLWEAAGLDWTPWNMDAAALAALPACQPLTEWDRNRIAQLRGKPLPNVLQGLLDEMERRGEKGEQEGHGAARGAR